MGEGSSVNRHYIGEQNINLDPNHGIWNTGIESTDDLSTSESMVQVMKQSEHGLWWNNKTNCKSTNNH